jgi:hypothetical protein
MEYMIGLVKASNKFIALIAFAYADIGVTVDDRTRALVWAKVGIAV